MNFLKNQFLARVYRKEMGSKLIKQKKKYSKKITTIGVILDGGLFVPEDLFINLASTFGLSKSKVSVLTYSDLNLKKELISNDRCFSPSDINFFGKFNNILNKFCLKRYDVLINYYDRNFLPMKLVSLRCNSKINVGFPNVDHKLNDLILNIDINDSLLFLSEVEKYLKLIHNGFKKEN